MVLQLGSHNLSQGVFNMPGVDDDKDELSALARMYALGEIDRKQYRHDRALLIDKYCGVDTGRWRSKAKSANEADLFENTLVFYSVLGAFGVLIFVFIVYVFFTSA